MKTFGKIMLGVLAFVGILALVFGINLLVIGEAYWIICLIFNLTFSWKYVIAIAIILAVLKSIFKSEVKINKD